jgi:hypothetical protein
MWITLSYAMSAALVHRLDEIEVVAIPKIGLNDPPPADQLTASRGAHAAAINFGKRTRL